MTPPKGGGETGKVYDWCVLERNLLLWEVRPKRSTLTLSWTSFFDYCLMMIGRKIGEFALLTHGCSVNARYGCFCVLCVNVYIHTLIFIA